MLLSLSGVILSNTERMFCIVHAGTGFRRLRGWRPPCGLFSGFFLVCERKGESCGMAEEPDLRYLCIDLKSFYASVECVERGLDPMKADLVVADPTRGQGTICLAVSHHLKQKGVRNRCRVFEIPKNCRYIMAPPRMALYIRYAADIYGISLRYIAKEDIHVYSVDEAFFDIASYRELYHMNAFEIGAMIRDDIRRTTGIPAVCGIGTNLYLAKVALDILAKHSPDQMAALDEASYIRRLGDHRPLTDFWMVGSRTARRLASCGILTMRDVAASGRRRMTDLFGINGSYLFDHALGIEPVTIAEIKAYQARSHSLSSHQVLLRDYSFREGEVIVREMTDQLCLELTGQSLVTDHAALFVGFSDDGQMPPVRKSAPLPAQTSSVRLISRLLVRLYLENVPETAVIRRIGITLEHVTDAGNCQLSLFSDEEIAKKDEAAQRAVLRLRESYGRSIICKGMDLLDAGTTRERLSQIGGHRAGNADSAVLDPGGDS